MGRKGKKHSHGSKDATKEVPEQNHNHGASKLDPVSVKPKIKNMPEENSPANIPETTVANPSQAAAKLPMKRKDYEAKAVLKTVSEDFQNPNVKLSLQDLVFAITKAAADRKKAAGSSKTDRKLKEEFGPLLKHIKKDNKFISSPLASSKCLTNKEGITEIKELMKSPSKPKPVKTVLKSPSTESLPNITEALLDSTKRVSAQDNSESGVKDDIGLCQKCEKDASTKCTGCRKVFYCSKECQKLHWNDHKDVCRPYKVSKMEGFGRVLVATRSISAEEEVLRERPFVVGPRPCSEPVCLTCYRRISGAFRCKKCSWPMCDEECAGNVVHSVECSWSCKASLGGPKGLTARGCDGQHSEIITALRSLVAYRQDPIKWRSMMDKFGARHRLVQNNSVQYAHNQQTIVEPIRSTIDLYPALAGINDDAIHTVLKVLQVHSVPSRSTYGEVIGLYPMASLIGHSCVPNTRTRLKGKHLVVTATENISVGSPLTAMFTDILWGTKARRDHLQQERFFSCSCRRCSDPTELGSYFSALVCPKCNEPVLPFKPLVSTAYWTCTACKYQVSSDDLLETNLTLGSEVAKELNNPTIKGLEILLAKWLLKVHSHHYHLHAIKHSLLQLYGRTDEKDETMERDENYWKEIEKKEKLCQEFLKVCSLLDPSMAHSVPQFGLAFYELHKSVLEYAKRNFEKERLGTDKLKKKMQLAKALLRRSMDILEDEADDTPEGILYSRCQEEFIAIGKWMLSAGLM